MDQTKIERLKALSEKDEPLFAATVRFSKALDREMRDFCAKNPGVSKSVVLRECVERGWKALNE
jgi:hypothetical protein